jgi:hypothetical protein
VLQLLEASEPASGTVFSAVFVKGAISGNYFVHLIRRRVASVCNLLPQHARGTHQRLMLNGGKLC